MGSHQSINDGKSLQSVNKGSDLSFPIVKKKKFIPRRESLPNLLLTVSLIATCFTIQVKLVHSKYHLLPGFKLWVNSTSDYRAYFQYVN